MDDAGNAMVVWYTNGQDGDSMGVYGQRVDVNNNLVGPEVHISTETAGAQDYPVVAMDANDTTTELFDDKLDGRNYT